MGAEQRLKTAFPNTKFFGADPLYEDGHVFEKIGKYLQVRFSYSVIIIFKFIFIGVIV